MYVIIAYDINTETAAGQKRLRKVAKQCENYGIRVQDSVFECDLEPGAYEELKAGLFDLADEKQDLVSFYHLGSNWQRRIERIGQPPPLRFDEDFFV